MPRSIAGDVIAGILETSLIQIRSSGPGCLMEADTGPELRADYVRTLIAVGQTAAIVSTIAIGCPDCKVMKLSNDHPPTIASATISCRSRSIGLGQRAGRR